VLGLQGIAHFRVWSDHTLDSHTFRVRVTPNSGHWHGGTAASLLQAVFPEGTPGSALDALARLPLWSDGLNYRHGTGVKRGGEGLYVFTWNKPRSVYV
jgi:hypothetical protein